MKKIIFIMAVAAAGVNLTSCDPLKAEGDFVSNTITAESLLKDATFAQYNMYTDDNGKEIYEPSPTGNYIEYNIPSVPAVTIKTADGKTLSYGRSGGMVYYMPPRGSEENQPLQFCYINDDGTEVAAIKEFTLTVAQALDPAVKVLVSNNGRKKWRWMPTDANGGAVWGNGGYLAGEQDGGITVNGAWWGCGVEDGDCGDKFSGQTQHAGSRYEEIKGECYALSYMEFNEDGSLNAYSNTGEQINAGSFSIKDYNNNEITNADNFSRGTLETSEGAILWPFAINTGGSQPTSFEIGYLDVSRMVLLYAAAGTGSWGECTWWSFMSDDDPSGILASHDWHWKPTTTENGAVWGNGGYCAGSQDGTGTINGAWWGCGVIDGSANSSFDSQKDHAGGKFDDFVGDCYAASKMVFNEDESSITIFDQDGNQIRQGSFSLDMTPDADKFRIGTLNTSEGTILWPFAINTQGSMPTVFDIGYLGSDAMVLLYSASGDAWSECSWWSFGK